jgi:hypothetical protein
VDRTRQGNDGKFDGVQASWLRRHFNLFRPRRCEIFKQFLVNAISNNLIKVIALYGNP